MDSPRLGDHICMVSNSVDHYLEFLLNFADNGLASGHQVKILVEMIEPIAMRAWLEARLPSATEALRDGALDVMAARSTYLKGGDFNPAAVMADFEAITERAQADGYKGVWASADMSWALHDSPLIARVMDFEAACNRVYLDRRLVGVCHYERRMLDLPTLSRVRSTHLFGEGQSELRFERLRDPFGLRLGGTADGSNAEAFAAILDTLRSVPGPVTLRTEGLRLSHAPSARLVVDLAGGRAHPTTVFASQESAPLLARLAQGGPGGIRIAF